LNKLKSALDNFWKWSQISEKNYIGIPPPLAKQAEREEPGNQVLFVERSMNI